MGGNVRSGKLLQWLAAAAATAAVTYLLNWVHANPATAGIAYLVLVVYLATRIGARLSLFVAALCALGFDYYFLPPYKTLWVVGLQAWIDLAAFVVSSLLVSRVAERGRQQRRQAERRQQVLERLYALSQEMMLYSDAEGLIHELPRMIARNFELDAAALLVEERDRVYAWPAEPPKSVDAGLRAVARGVQPIVELTLGYNAVSLMVGLRQVGALAWEPGTGLQREAATAVAAQVAMVLARAMTMEASARVEAAREADRLRAALVDSLTHELRTPLTSIRAASTTLLGTGSLDEESRQDLVRVIDEEASRLDELIGESVEIAEVDANVVRVRPTPHPPGAFLEETVEQLRKALAGRQVEIGGDDSIDVAWFDGQLLGRVLRHLLENAASYTPAGSRISLGFRRNGERLEFRVEDEGPGIDEADLPLIFGKFYRGRRGMGARKGSGMGLAIARAILMAHGGGIEAASEPGKGACFRFWVPLVEREPGAAQDSLPERGDEPVI
jgi:two-component system sensor histidine kinase KdpD